MSVAIQQNRTVENRRVCESNWNPKIRIYLDLFESVIVNGESPSSKTWEGGRVKWHISLMQTYGHELRALTSSPTAAAISHVIFMGAFKPRLTSYTGRLQVAFCAYRQSVDACSALMFYSWCGAADSAAAAAADAADDDDDCRSFRSRISAA